MNRLSEYPLIVVLLLLVFLLSACQGQESINNATSAENNTVPTIVSSPPSAERDASEEDAQLAPTQTAEERYYACVEETLSGEPVRLSLAPEDCAWIALFGCIMYPTGDDQWLIQTAEKQTILTSLVSESDLYLCPDDFLERRNAYQPKNASEYVLFLGAEEASEQPTERCIVTDALDVYIRWDGAYYIPTAERGEEIRQTVTDMALALCDYMQEIVNTYADEMEKDMFFIPPIFPEDTADAF